jgi:lysophospholipase L1-like esterase
LPEAVDAAVRIFEQREPAHILDGTDLETLLYHYYSGHLFVSVAAVFVVLGILDAAGSLDRRPAARRAAGFLAVLSIALAALAAPPLPLALLLGVLVATCAYAFVGFGTSRRLPLAIVAIAAVITAVALELPSLMRRGNVETPSSVVVIGDSLSSGGFAESSPWPRVMENILRVPVHNLALPSETTAMAVRNQLPRLPVDVSSGECIVILIGGNDMLEGVPVSEFRTALDRLLSTAAAGGRRVVVFELPLLPGGWRYGRAQRSLASKHSVTLVPKRILAGVLLDPANTDDGIHLTQRGHDVLARRLVRWLGWGTAR